MKDTHPIIAKKMLEMMRKKTAQERLLMGFSMYDMSKQLVINSILNRNPNISQSILRQEIFLKFYGNDFDLETRNRIVKHLADCVS